MSGISKAIYLLGIIIIIFLFLFVWKTTTSQPDQQVLPNPSWNPTTMKGLDGGRDWTYTSNAPGDCAYQLNDLWGGSFTPVSDGSVGFLKVEVNGTNANDFQYAQSQWFAANRGETWSASVLARAPYQELNGDQVALLKIEFADKNYNILNAAQTNVVTSTTPDAQYWPGEVTLTADPKTAYVHIQAGVWNPTDDNYPGYAHFDDAALKPMPGSARSTTLFCGVAALLLIIIVFHVSNNRGKRRP